MSVNAVELDRVTLARGEHKVLAEVSIAIRAGEFVGVFGPNGAGKTTLLHAILGLIRPLSGELRVFGTAPARGNRDAGYLPQQPRKRRSATCKGCSSRRRSLADRSSFSSTSRSPASTRISSRASSSW